MNFKIVSQRAVMPGGAMLSCLRNGAFKPFCEAYFSGSLAEETAAKRLPALSKPFMSDPVFDAPKAVLAIGKGRLNIIGEHNDHELCTTVSVPMENGTLCLGLAEKSESGQGTITFKNMEARFPEVKIKFSELSIGKTAGDLPWHYYPAACIRKLIATTIPEFTEAFANHNVTLIFDGAAPYGVPVASGLSSSAAIEMAALIACVNLFQDKIQNPVARHQLAEIGVAAENLIANCGRLDQHTSIAPAGRQGVMIDYWQIVRGNWDKAYQFFQVPEGILFGVVSSNQEASTAAAAYRIRRLSGWVFADRFFDLLQNNWTYRPFQSQARDFMAADYLRKEAPSLRDVFDFCRSQNLNPLSMWNRVIMLPFSKAGYSGQWIIDQAAELRKNELLDRLLDDCGLNREQIALMPDVFKPNYGMYVLGEQGWVNDLFRLMEQGRINKIGPLLSMTHLDMSHVYEMGTEGNDRIFRILATIPGVIGGRIVGAGMGGYNMFAITGASQSAREEVFDLAQRELAKEGFKTSFMAPPGCGSAVFEPSNVGDTGGLDEDGI